jgi:hypothetical protein
MRFLVAMLVGVLGATFVVAVTSTFVGIANDLVLYRRYWDGSYPFTIGFVTFVCVAGFVLLVWPRNSGESH